MISLFIEFLSKVDLWGSGISPLKRRNASGRSGPALLLGAGGIYGTDI